MFLFWKKPIKTQISFSNHVMIRMVGETKEIDERSVPCDSVNIGILSVCHF